MKCSKNICLTLISLLGAATIGLTSCKDQPDEYKSTTGSPEIQYVRLPESADSVITKSYLQTTIVLLEKISAAFARCFLMTSKQCSTPVLSL